MVDFVIMKANKPTATRNFHFISPFVWQQSPKSQFFGRKSSPKITLFVVDFFRQKINFKIKSLHLYKAIAWFLVGISFLAIFVGHASAIFLEPVSP